MPGFCFQPRVMKMARGFFLWKGLFDAGNSHSVSRGEYRSEGVESRSPKDAWCPMKCRTLTNCHKPISWTTPFTDESLTVPFPPPTMPTTLVRVFVV